MASSRPLWRRARVIVTLLVALAVLPSAGLAWATWQLLDQDRGLVRRQSMDRLNNAALLVTSHLRVLLLEARRALAAGEPGPAGAIAITMHAGGISVMPADRIAFLPVPVALPDAPQDAADRGTASLARGRDLLRSGRNDAALDAFAEVRDLPPFSIDGVPSWMAARYLRGQTLERTGVRRSWPTRRPGYTRTCRRSHDISMARSTRRTQTMSNDGVVRSFRKHRSC